MKTWLFNTIFFLFLIIYAFPITAQTESKKEQARIMNMNALKLAKEKKFSDSIDLLKKAHSVYPLPIILWNIARNYEFMKDYTLALYWFEEFEKVNEEQIKGQNELLSKIDEIVSHVPCRLTITGAPVNAKILLDARNYNIIPFKEVGVTQEAHTISISNPGFTEQIMEINTTGQTYKTVNYKLMPIQGKIFIKGDMTAPVTFLINGKQSVKIVSGQFLLLPYGSYSLQVIGSKAYENLVYQVLVSEKPIEIKLKKSALQKEMESINKTIFVSKIGMTKSVRIVSLYALNTFKHSDNKAISKIDSIKTKTIYVTNSAKWILFGVGTALMIGGGASMFIGYFNVNKVEQAGTTKDGYIDEITMTDAVQRLNHAKYFYYAGYGLIGAGFTTFVISLFLKNKYPVVKKISFIPLHNGIAGMFTTSW